MDVGRVVRRVWPLGAVLGLLLVVLVLSNMSGPQVTQVPFPTPTFTMPSSTPPAGGLPSRTALPTGPPRRQSENTGASTLGTVFTVLLALAVLAGLVVLAWYLWPRLPRLRLRLRGIPLETVPVELEEEDRERSERAAAQVRSAVQAGIDLLDDQSADPRRAVIACWLRLEAAAAEAGTGREPGDTPAELVQRMLAGHRVSEPLLQRLAGLYRLARYGPAEVDPSMRGTALGALTQLRTELARRPEPEPEAEPETDTETATDPATDAATSQERR